jgi:putative Ca2+/H+ antiporter (TMEM165/GDT1 family)
MLAAKYNALTLVVTGTLLGMMMTDVPVVLVGKLAAPKIPFKIARVVARGAACAAWRGRLARPRHTLETRRG